MNSILYLGSRSRARQILLQEACIAHCVIDQQADEQACDWGLPFLMLLETIALHKMNNLMLDSGKQSEVRFVLTADTMGCDSDGIVHGKPQTKEDAIEKIKVLRKGGSVATAFCLDKKVWGSGGWHTQERIIECISTSYIFDMPDIWIERYLEKVPHYKEISGAITIEGYGAQFLKEIKGSYTTILGLPMFELRQALEKIGFF